uniref:Uncharacterized protein n=1 Tax=Globodera rostochiensis TaxID=31243 RepID=A0A914HHG7_GLORO
MLSRSATPSESRKKSFTGIKIQERYGQIYSKFNPLTAFAIEFKLEDNWSRRLKIKDIASHPPNASGPLAQIVLWEWERGSQKIGNTIILNRGGTAEVDCDKTASIVVRILKERHVIENPCPPFSSPADDLTVHMLRRSSSGRYELHMDHKPKPEIRSVWNGGREVSRRRWWVGEWSPFCVAAAPTDCTMIVSGLGLAAGIDDDGRSPLHFATTKLLLLPILSLFCTLALCQNVPPSNVAEGRQVSASSICGEVNGRPIRECVIAVSSKAVAN